MAEPKKQRDDDSLNAATVAINDVQSRVGQIETALTTPDQLGQLIANAVEKSSPLRKQLSGVIIELLDDHDTRKRVKTVLAKIDREEFWRWGKYIGAFLVWLATIVGAIFAYIAIAHPGH
jgi:hypothetical protein